MNVNETLKDISKSIRSFIVNNYLFGYEDNELDEDLSFLEMGVLDSTGIIELVVFIEEEFNIKVDNEEIIPENLDSVSCISNYVYRKLEHC